MELDFEGLEIQRKKNIPTDKAQRVDEKDWVICLFTMFTHEVMVIKMSKITHFLHFLLITPKNK